MKKNNTVKQSLKKSTKKTTKSAQESMTIGIDLGDDGATPNGVSCRPEGVEENHRRGPTARRGNSGSGPKRGRRANWTLTGWPLRFPAVSRDS